jgi:hypothetical protein
MLEYTQLESEGEFIKKDNDPKEKWPSKGEIEIHDLKMRYK